MAERFAVYVDRRVMTLGGGIGYLSRRFALSIDNLIEVDMILANGEFIKASAESLQRGRRCGKGGRVVCRWRAQGRSTGLCPHRQAQGHAQSVARRVLRSTTRQDSRANRELRSR